MDLNRQQNYLRSMQQKQENPSQKTDLLQMQQIQMSFKYQLPKVEENPQKNSPGEAMDKIQERSAYRARRQREKAKREKESETIDIGPRPEVAESPTQVHSSKVRRYDQPGPQQSNQKISQLETKECETVIGRPTQPFQRHRDNRDRAAVTTQQDIQRVQLKPTKYVSPQKDMPAEPHLDCSQTVKSREDKSYGRKIASPNKPLSSRQDLGFVGTRQAEHSRILSKSRQLINKLSKSRTKSPIDGNQLRKSALKNDRSKSRKSRMRVRSPGLFSPQRDHTFLRTDRYRNPERERYLLRAGSPRMMMYQNPTWGRPARIFSFNRYDRL